MKNNDLNLQPPPRDVGFWELFDFFWDHGVGNSVHEDGTSIAWTALTLESAFEGKPDKRSIEYWQSRTNMPSPENIRKISSVAGGGNHAIRKAWHDALIAARRVEKRKDKTEQKAQAETQKPNASQRRFGTMPPLKWVFGMAIIVVVGVVTWWQIQNASLEPSVENIRICDAAFFDAETKKCRKHVSVFVHGVDEVFLSFDFVNVPDGTPFERWWIRNGERVAGRSSFNDVAWPGYTYWRPGVLEMGQYVVRIVVEDQVFTQVFSVQQDGFSENS